MKAAVVVVIVGAASVVGYFLGSRHEAPRPISLIDIPVPAVDRDSTRADERTAVAPFDSAPQAARYDPASAMRVELEALRRGDVSTVARGIVLTPEGKAVIESALALVPSDLAREYPTPELLAAFVFCGAQRIEGFRIESTTYEQDDRATQRVGYKFESESEWRTEEISFLRGTDGWYRVVDVGVAQRVAAIVGIQRR